MKPAFLLGLGLGGFVDGIVLHQILQWHHMVSDTPANPPTTVAGLEANTLADGLFHAVTWVLVALAVVGFVRLWRSGAAAPAWPVVLGSVLAGCGVFNLVEGLIDHIVLGVHHVRDDLGGPLAWDLAFLALGLAQVAGGALLVRSRQARRTSTAAG
jgi:uncharacterized membrane protein